MRRSITSDERQDRRWSYVTCVSVTRREGGRHEAGTHRYWPARRDRVGHLGSARPHHASGHSSRGAVGSDWYWTISRLARSSHDSVDGVGDAISPISIIMPAPTSLYISLTFFKRFKEYIDQGNTRLKWLIGFLTRQYLLKKHLRNLNLVGNVSYRFCRQVEKSPSTLAQQMWCCHD